eukprot:XP_016661443.1 PREDICTED: prostatic acid phosphatase-like isoform X1 [Acyrthosiphon pisum]
MNKLTMGTIIFICNIGKIISVDPLAYEYGHLVFSTLLYRHGDRSIERTYTNDPYANKSYWPMGFGQLTPSGIEKQFKLGKWLRKRYSEWLPEVYSAEDVYVRSSDYDRTIMSAQANLAGLYPLVGPRDWNMEPGKHIQLVPIHTVPKSMDNLLLMSESCPLYSQELDKVVNDFEVQKFYAQFSSALKYMEKNSNLEMGKKTVIKSTTLLYDALLVESQFNYILPKWTKSIFPEPLLTIAKENEELATHTNTLKRLKTGPLLNEVVTHMYEKKNGTLSPNRMLWVYSAHDTTMVNLLNAFELYEHLLVPYAAVLMIELRLNTTGNYVVTISYRNTSNREPYLLHVPGCDSVACELDIFIDVLRPLISVDWDVECKSDVENHILTFFNIITIIVIILVSCVIAGKILSLFKKKSGYQTF